MPSDGNSLVDSLTKEGIALARAGDLPHALDYFRRCLALAPNRPDVLTCLGLTLCKIGAREEGCAYFDQALSVCPGYVDALYNKGLYLETRRQYAEAIGLFVDALTQEPQRTDILRSCGFSHLMIGNIATASLTYARVGQLEPDFKSDSQLMEYIRYLWAILNKDQEHLAAVDSLLGTSDDASALYARSRVKVHLGQIDEALKLLETATGKDAAFARVAANDPCFDNLFLTSQRFRALVQPALAPSAVATLELLSNRAAACHKSGKYKEAIENSEKVLHDFRSLLGDRFLFARTWQNLAESHFRLGQFREGVQCFEQLLQLIGATRGTNCLEFLDALSAAAEAYRGAANYEGAASLYQNAIDVTRRTLGSAPNLAAYLTSLAIVNLDLGNYEETCSRYKEALEVIRGNTNVRYKHLVRVLNNLATLYRLQGDYRNAESVCAQAVEIARKRLDLNSLDLAASLRNLGHYQALHGETRKVMAFFRETLSIVEQNYSRHSREFANNLNDLAAVIWAAGGHKRAEKLFQQVIQIYRKTGNIAVPKYAGILSNLANLYLQSGRYSQAERLYKEAIAIDPAKTRGFAQKYNLAILYHRKGRFADAEAMYKKAIDAYKAMLGEHHPDTILLCTQLAQLYNDMDDCTNAMILLDDAVDRSDRIINLLLAITSDTQRLAYLSRIQFCIEMYVAIVLQRHPKSRVYKGKALDLILRRKGIGFEASVLQREALLRRYASVAPKLRELRALRNQIGTMSIRGPAAGEEESHSKILAELNTKRARLEEELTNENPDLPIEKGVAAFSRKTIAEAMRPGSVLVEFVALNTEQYRRHLGTRAGRHYIVFVLHADRLDHVAMIDLGSTARIDRMILFFRKAVMTMEPESAEKTVGARLRKAVFEPLQPSLKNKHTLILARDGNLALLPFEILPAADGGRLVDHYEISYVGSGRDVLRFRDTPETQFGSGPVVVADPDFDMDDAGTPLDDSGGRVLRSLDFNSTNVKKFVRLEGTQEEGRRVGERLGVQPLTGRDALEGRVKSVRSPSILHLASHAFFLQRCKESQSISPPQSPELTEGAGMLEGLARLQRLENPMLRSGIALAGANLTLAGKNIDMKDAEDGILTAADIVSELELSSTALVVLSACETGLGEVEVGEGVFGLSRSFGLAGAQTLVMSLWQVDDTITQETMDLLYANVAEGRTCSAAVREAQLAMKMKYPAPYFWGAFICHGNPNSIPIRRDETQLAGASA
jgi:tetratricopeptide (TPR) repeat protein